MIARAVVGSLVLFLGIAAAVFVPAGTVRYWQAWAYLAVFVAGTSLIAAVVARLLDEERYLCAHLRGYRDYRRRVRHRLIPYAW